MSQEGGVRVGMKLIDLGKQKLKIHAECMSIGGGELG